MLKGHVDAVIVEGSLATNRSAPLIDRVRRINPKIKIIVTTRTQSIKEEVETPEQDYVAIVPTSAQTMVDKVMTLTMSDLKPSIDQ